MKKNAGFTLIELLIALVLSIVIVGAVYATFNSQQKSFSLTNQKMDMQQQMRQAMNLIMRDLRMAGCGMIEGVTIKDEKFEPIQVGDGGENEPDSIGILYGSGDRSNDIHIKTPMPRPSAELNVDHVEDEGGKRIINEDEIWLISLPSGGFGSLLQVTHVQKAALKIQHNPGGEDNINSATNPNFPQGGYPAGSRLTKFLDGYHYYYIDNTDPSHPVLMVDRSIKRLLGGSGSPQRLAENIEDLQIAYLDKDGSTWYNKDKPSPSSPPEVSNIRAVRITLVARTAIPDPDYIGQRPAIENRAAGPKDHYRRRILRALVKVRNLGL